MNSCHKYNLEIISEISGNLKQTAKTNVGIESTNSQKTGIFLNIIVITIMITIVSQQK